MLATFHSATSKNGVEFGRRVKFRRLMWTLKKKRVFHRTRHIHAGRPLRAELPIGNNNAVIFKHRPKKGNGRGTTWGRYISWVTTCFGLLREGSIYRVSVSWLIRADGYSLSQMPLAPSIRMLHIIFISYFPPRTVKEDDMVIFFYST